jgi:hypothetical protein
MRNSEWSSGWIHVVCGPSCSERVEGAQRLWQYKKSLNWGVFLLSSSSFTKMWDWSCCPVLALASIMTMRCSWLTTNGLSQWADATTPHVHVVQYHYEAHVHSRARDPDQHSAGGQAGVLVNVKPLQSRIACNDMVDLLYVHRADQDSPKSQNSQLSIQATSS